MDVAERAMLADARAEHVPLYLPGHVLHVATGPADVDRSVQAGGGGGHEARGTWGGGGGGHEAGKVVCVRGLVLTVWESG